MKIAIVSSIPVYPPFGGNRSRIKTMVKALEADGHEIHFILLSSRKIGEFDHEGHENAFPRRFHLLRRTNMGEAFYLAKRAYRTSLKKGLNAIGVRAESSVDEVFYSPFLQPIREILQSVEADAVVAEYTYFSRVLEVAPAGALRVIDTHDSNMGWFSARELQRAFSRADIVIAIQEEEATSFRQLIANSSPAVVMVSHIPELCRPVDASGDFCGATFLGSSFAANILSINYFIDCVLPIVLERLPAFTLNVAGSICNDISDHPAVNKLGKTETAKEAFVQNPLLINPIRHGTGVKIKLIDAMTYGVPVVSTRFGVRGISPKFLNGVAVVEDDDARGFAAEVVSIATDKQRRMFMAQANLSSTQQWADQQIAALREIFPPTSS